MSTNLFANALSNASRIAVRNPSTKTHFSYCDLLFHANILSQNINSFDLKSDSYPPRINLLVPPSFEYAASTYAIWSNNCVSVPLCTSHPVNEMDYYVKDCESSLIIAHSSYLSQAKHLSETNNHLPYLIIDNLEPTSSTSCFARTEIENYAEMAMNTIQNDNPSLFIYTSGTTSKPKGVVHTHNSIWSNIETLNEEWFWSKDDSILNVLPLHHIHGLVNITLCALSNGALITFDDANPIKIWQNFEEFEDLNVFMAVPTIYAKLIEVYKKMSIDEQEKCQQICQRFRLMVSGSAALPNKIMNEWFDISGHKLLERYGMTEILMAISNKYEGKERRAGTVGFPLRNVQTRIAEEDGELFIKSDGMFKEYYNKLDKTKEEFTEDGWFKTGDCAVIDDDGYYKIQGRKSIDIIKYGGYKISALEIERIFLENEQIKECVVLGVDDETYGQKIAALIVLKDGVDGDSVSLDTMKEWAKDKMAKYKIPQMMLFVQDIPKNAMGKVAKKNLVSLFESTK